MPEAERETVRFAIRCHLEMWQEWTAATIDPATAEYLAHKVGTVERLKHLTLVTYADISAVNPSARNERLPAAASRPAADPPDRLRRRHQDRKVNSIGVKCECGRHNLRTGRYPHAG